MKENEKTTTSTVTCGENYLSALPAITNFHPKEKSGAQSEHKSCRRKFICAELEVEKVLRPSAFEDFLGQEKVVANLKVFIAAANSGAMHSIMCCFTVHPV
jgi:hypothetical protein